MAEELSRSLSRIFLRDSNGRRPVYGGIERFQKDPYWRDLILFYEYFHGETGAGLGAVASDGLDGFGGEADRAEQRLGAPISTSVRRLFESVRRTHAFSATGRET